MLGLFFLATLAWILALIYYRFASISKEKFQNTLGLKFIAFFFGSFILMILLLKFVTGLNSSQAAENSDSPSGGGLSLLQWIFIISLSCLLWNGLFGEISTQLKRWLMNFPRWQAVSRLTLAILIALLILQQIFWDNHFLNNIFLFTVIVIVIEFAMRLKRGAFALMFGLIMLLDIYLVWITSGSGQGSKVSWYVSMFQSEFMQYFPFPIGFRWGNRLLGNGDVAFMCITVMYTRRVWGLVPAVVAGVVTTLPLLLLPFAVQLLGVSPPAWPYTIFIAPVALFIAIFAKEKTR